MMQEIEATPASINQPDRQHHMKPPPIIDPDIDEPRPTARRLVRWSKPAILVGLIGLAAFVWMATPLSDVSDVDGLMQSLHLWAALWWAPLAMIAIYVVAGLVAFPLTALIAATGMLYGAWLGLALALTAGIVAASVGFVIGHFLGHQAVQRMRAGPLGRISATLGRHGLVTVAILRITPVASFAAINYLAGASHVRYRDFVAGTLIGGTPYALTICLFGDVLEETLRQPSWGNVTLLIAVFLAVLAVAIGANWLVIRWRARRAGAVSQADSPAP